MDNYLIKTLACNKQARIFFVENTELIRTVCNHHKMNKLLRAALGTTVSIASMISGTLKGTERISLKIRTRNHQYGIFADTDSTGNVRGYISDELLNAPSDELDHLSIEQLIGAKGCIQITKDIGMNNLFTGITDMPHRNIVDDISYYYKQSEQTTSYFSVNIAFDEKNEVVSSRGIMAQLLPGAPARLIHRIKKIISQNLSYMKDPANEGAMEELSQSMFKDIDVVGIQPVRLFCGCSKELLFPMLYSLDQEELVNAYENNKLLEIVCNVCGEKYTFDTNEIESLI
ncbi:Hsp33 family molecular chaperone HslO [Paenibacillus sp. J2TS4]|uniref:Hsp33 family molecular chaperone HslO n=1 Tax=Paenibacillus sp. J2TS4 TaxID=2807194 RepID=UPI001B1DD9B5|nr:Hsp33 family molecular chaperone HslO [Paenibacillus sp. J2TS4]GIP36131.1 hypothetical protein J2TS4_53410 [Paenibacillus sp. J2TS4]